METASAAVTAGSTTIADLLPRAVERYGDRVAQKHKVDGEWRDITLAEVDEIVSEIGRGLIDLGVQPGERVSMLCSTRVEWTWCSLAISAAGAVVVPIYPTNSPEECAWVAGNSESVVIICEDSLAARQDRCRPRSAARRLRQIVVDRRRRHAARGSVALDEVRARGRCARTGRARRADRQRRQSRRVHVHLHVRDNRAAEGLRPVPGQLPRRARHGRRARHRFRPRRPDLPVPPARPRFRAASDAGRRGPRRRDRLLGSRYDEDHRRAVRGPTDLPAVGPADLREALHAGHLAGRSRS